MPIFARRTDWNLTTNLYTRALEEHRRSGRELLDLTVSNPTEAGFTFEDERILGALRSTESMRYEPASKGLFSARQAVARYYADHQVNVHPEHLLLTTSTSEAYTWCFRLLCEPGDEVLVPTPSYPLFEFLADIQDVRLVPYELVYHDGWQVDFHGLQQRAGAKSRAVIVVNPNNPTGSFLRRHELEELSTICREHDMAIVADEVFLDYGLQAAASTCAANGDCLTFTLSGLSKISALPQMKVAWIAVSGPEGLRTEAVARLELIADTYLSMNAPIQHALPEMLETRHGIQRQMNQRVRANLAELDRQLAQQKHSCRLEVEGGWYAVLRVPITRTDEQLAIELIDREDVLVQPGHFYDFGCDGYLVVSLITPEVTFAEGIGRVLRYIEKL